MRRPRIFLGTSALPGQEVDLPAESRHHLVRVLRLGPGDGLIGVTPEGLELDLELVSTEAARVVGGSRPQVEPTAELTLALCIAKGGRMDWAVEKAVEIGVTAIQPLIATRSPAGEAGAQRVLRWQRLAEAAARQSGRQIVPEVRPALSVEQTLRAGPRLRLIAHPAGAASIADCLTGLETPEPILVAIGPEGGWTGAEVALAVAAGAIPVRLGSRILRVETAAVVASTLVLAAFGDLGSLPVR